MKQVVAFYHANTAELDHYLEATLAQLDRQTHQQRLDDLRGKPGLSDGEKQELRELLAEKGRRA